MLHKAERNRGDAHGSIPQSVRSAPKLLPRGFQRETTALTAELAASTYANPSPSCGEGDEERSLLIPPFPQSRGKLGRLRAQQIGVGYLPGEFPHVDQLRAGRFVREEAAADRLAVNVDPVEQHGVS